MKKSLIDLLKNSPSLDVVYDGYEGWEKAADYLLANCVIVLPCKIGDIVYVHPTKENGLKEITEMRCLGFELSEPCPVANLFDWKNTLYQASFDRFGVSVFLPKCSQFKFDLR